MDALESNKSTIALSRIPKLESPTEWKKWENGITEWGVDQDLDLPVPTEPAALAPAIIDPVTIATHTQSIIAYEEKQSKFLRKHQKAANSVKSTCTDRGKDIIGAMPLANMTFQAVIEALALEFKPTPEAYLAITESEWDELCLASCKNVDEYTKEFNRLQAELKALQNELPHHSLISKYIGGLGNGFASWNQSFEIQRNLNGIPSNLSNVMNAVKAEETRMHRDGRAPYAFTSNAPPQTQSSHHGGGQGNQRGGRGGNGGYRGGGQGQPDGGQNSDYCRECRQYYHSEDGCWKLHPELEAIWRKKNPEKAAMRDGRRAEKRWKQSRRGYRGYQGGNDRRSPSPRRGTQEDTDMKYAPVPKFAGMAYGCLPTQHTHLK